MHPNQGAVFDCTLVLNLGESHSYKFIYSGFFTPDLNGGVSEQTALIFSFTWRRWNSLKDGVLGLEFAGSAVVFQLGSNGLNEDKRDLLKAVTPNRLVDR